MVEVFKTNVQKKAQSKMLLCILSEAFPSFKINFDLSDCDKVLRVEGDNVKSLRIMILVKEYGFNCEILLDEQQNNGEAENRPDNYRGD
ncbi:hypothetical protein [Agriterribacter humi]|jgi:hypothetical protein|uniref:hypothetical protein n=1 Tax=Agriterribacter humi TaxID=1104781 RepID=UPI001263FC03|nr:hypothetical protein [Agriterribacter humi]